MKYLKTIIYKGGSYVEVPGYEGLYYVDDIGNIYSQRTGKILKPHLGNKGYLILTLSNKGVRKTAIVHRVVAMARIQNPKNLAQVNHKDGNKLNNHVSNLEWCTGHENIQHAYKTGLNRGIKNKPSISYPIYQCDLSGNIIKEFPSAAEAGRAIGSTGNTVAQVANGGFYRTRNGKRYWQPFYTLRGYKWVWKEKPANIHPYNKQRVFAPTSKPSPITL